MTIFYLSIRQFVRNGVTINVRLGIDRVTNIFFFLQVIEHIYSSVIALWLDTHKHTTNIHLTILIRQELPFDHTHTIHTHIHTHNLCLHLIASTNRRNTTILIRQELPFDHHITHTTHTRTQPFCILLQSWAEEA